MHLYSYTEESRVIRVRRFQSRVHPCRNYSHHDPANFISTINQLAFDFDRIGISSLDGILRRIKIQKKKEKKERRKKRRERTTSVVDNKGKITRKIRKKNVSTTTSTTTTSFIYRVLEIEAHSRILERSLERREGWRTHDSVPSLDPPLDGPGNQGQPIPPTISSRARQH